MENSLQNYSGPLYLELDTASVINQPEITRQLNENSNRIIHNDEKPAVTTWEMSDLSAALKMVLIFQNEGIPFSLLGEPDLLFIKQLP